MAKIKVTSKCALYDGMIMTFKAPCNCSAADGLNVYHQNVMQTFSFRDAHGNDVSNTENLFGLDAYVTVSLDTTNGYAYIQNADTNSYLESHINNTENPHRVTAEQVGAAPAGLHRTYGSLVDIGITTFPTTMEAVANAMPNNSMIVIDTRTIMSGGAQEISDWGNTSNGTAYINKGYSIARVTMMIIYGSGNSVKGRLFVGSWANSTNKVGWVDYGYDGNASYPGCFYRAVDGVTEWINPPMIMGVEYRTTERWQGRPVYALGFTIGRLEAGTTIIKYADSTSDVIRNINIRQPIEIKLYGNGTTDLTGSNLFTNINFDRSQVNIISSSAIASCDLYLKYTKI